VASLGARAQRAAALGRRGARGPASRRRIRATLLRVQPWRTLRQLARATVRDPRLRLVIERFATYGRRGPAPGARGARPGGDTSSTHSAPGTRAAGSTRWSRRSWAGSTRSGELRLSTPVHRIHPGRGVETAAGLIAADVVVANVDAERVARDLLRRPWKPRERSVSGLALMLGLRGRTPGLAHHSIEFPADYDAEFDDVFVHRRPVRDPTVYVSASTATDPDEGARDGRGVVRARQRAGDRGRRRLERGGAAAGRAARRGGPPRALVIRSPADLERETGRRGRRDLRRRAARTAGARCAARACRCAAFPGSGRSAGPRIPGGGLPLVALGGKIVADAIGPAWKPAVTRRVRAAVLAGVVLAVVAVLLVVRGSPGGEEPAALLEERVGRGPVTTTILRPAGPRRRFRWSCSSTAGARRGPSRIGRGSSIWLVAATPSSIRAIRTPSPLRHRRCSATCLRASAWRCPDSTRTRAASSPSATPRAGRSRRITPPSPGASACRCRAPS
jgi:hypothetical protein